MKFFGHVQNLSMGSREQAQICTDVCKLTGVLTAPLIHGLLMDLLYRMCFYFVNLCASQIWI